MSDWIQYNHPNEGRRGFADIYYKRMSGQPAAGFYRWRIDLGIAFHEQTEGRVLPNAMSDVECDLCLSANELLLARFSMRESRNDSIDNRYGRTKEFSIEADIDGRRILAIEELRRSGSLSLLLKLNAVAIDTKSGTNYPADANLRFNVNQSDWATVLQGMGYRKTLLLEIAEPNVETNPMLAEATKHLIHASEQLMTGKYRSTVGDCRDTLEILSNLIGEVGDIPDEVKQWLKRDDSETKAQRLARVNAMLFRLTHLARHADNRTEWDYKDARAVLMMTGALLQLAENGSSNGG
jgi:hypothetical protein